MPKDRIEKGSHVKKAVSKKWFYGIIVVGFLGIILAFYLGTITSGKIYPQGFTQDIAKIILQFSLTTLGGGILFLYLNEKRDRLARKETIAREFHGFIRDIEAIDRTMKRVARKIRADISTTGDGDVLIEREAFRTNMFDLLDCQIKSEEVRENLDFRMGIVADEDRQTAIYSTLWYATRYFRSVFEEFETGKIRGGSSNYALSGDCHCLRDFISDSRAPSGLPPIGAEWFPNSEKRKISIGEMTRVFDTERTVRPRRRLVSRLALDLAQAHIKHLAEDLISSDSQQDTDPKLDIVSYVGPKYRSLKHRAARINAPADRRSSP